MQKTIQSRAIKKLIIWGSILSLIMGLVVGFIELKRIDNEVKSVVFHQAEAFYEPYYEYYADSNSEQLTYLQMIMKERVSRGQFVLLELYYNDRQKLIQHAAGGIHELKEKLGKKQSDKDEAISYTRIFHNGIFYLKIVAPFMVLNQGKITAYFEGIYRISEEQTDLIISRIVFSVAQVIVAIIIVTFLLYPIIISLNKDLFHANRHLIKANIDTLKVLGNAIAKRDSDTNSHNFRVTIYAISLGEQIKLERKQMQALIKGAFLHDIGKIGISDNILLKPDKLNEEEFSIMKKHVEYGVDIIKNNIWLSDARNVVEFHHEKYNGSGYMQGLSKDDIPITARIFAIVDVFDALTSKRPYKEPFSLEQSLEILHKGSGSHFDPQLIEAFNQLSSTLYNEYSGVDDEFFLRQRLDLLITNYF